MKCARIQIISTATLAVVILQSLSVEFSAGLSGHVDSRYPRTLRKLSTNCLELLYARPGVGVAHVPRRCPCPGIYRASRRRCNIRSVFGKALAEDARRMLRVCVGKGTSMSI